MIVECKNCKKELNKPPARIKRFPNHFCNRSCAATYNNKKFPKRKLEGICIKCGEPCSSELQQCKKCINKFKEQRAKEIDNLTLSQVKYNKKFPSGTYAKMSRVRMDAKDIAKNAGLLKECAVCGETDCLHTCHVKEISSYPESTLVKDVNNLSNLIGLCPTCHNKLHANLISIELIEAKVALRNKQLSLF